MKDDFPEVHEGHVRAGQISFSASKPLVWLSPSLHDMLESRERCRGLPGTQDNGTLFSYAEYGRWDRWCSNNSCSRGLAPPLLLGNGEIVLQATLAQSTKCLKCLKRGEMSCN